MLSAVRLGPVSVGSVACAADAAVLLAVLDDDAADAAPPRVELPSAGPVGVVAVAAVLVLVDLALEHVVGSLERGELGAAVLELDAELSESRSCSCSTITQVASPFVPVSGFHSSISMRAPSRPGSA
jgi:hypothetical protein